jgi:hypothetical protein
VRSSAIVGVLFSFYALKSDMAFETTIRSILFIYLFYSKFNGDFKK